jgi:hypothetical protein
MVHDGIADEDDALDVTGLGRSAREQFLCQVANLFADQALQSALTSAGHGRFYTAHYIRPALRLRIQLGANGRDMARLQVKQLGHNGGGA